MLKLTTIAYIVITQKKSILGLLPCQHQTHTIHFKAFFYIYKRFISGLVLSGDHHYQFQLIIQPKPVAADRGQQKSGEEERLPGNDIAHKRQHGLVFAARNVRVLTFTK